MTTDAFGEEARDGDGDQDVADEDGRKFDPRETGPLDLLRSWRFRLGRFADDNSTECIIGFVLLVLGVWYFDVGFPTLPNWMLVGIAATAFAAAPSLWLGWRLAKELYEPDNVLLSVQNPANGDQDLVWLAPERFDALEVLNHNDKKRDRGFLHEVLVNGRRAYEVDRYDREENVAVASWQAGVSNSAIRRDRSEIKRIKTSLEQEADKALELLANHPDILRQQAREVSNRLVKVAEGVEVPQGGNLHERLSDLLEEADPSEDLLEGTESNDDEPVSDAGTIHERAAANGSGEASADD